MKKVLALVAIAGSLALFSCGGGNKENTNNNADTAKVAPAPAPDTAKKMMPDTAHHMSDTAKKVK